MYKSSLELWIANVWGGSFESIVINGGLRRGWRRSGTNGALQEWLKPLSSVGLKADVVRVNNDSFLVCPTADDLRAGTENARLIEKYKRKLPQPFPYDWATIGLRYSLVSKTPSDRKDALEIYANFQDLCAEINREAQEDRYIVRSYSRGSGQVYKELIQLHRYMICPVTMYPQGGRDDD